MCLAIPGRVEEITTDGLIRIGRVNFGGVVKRVCLDYVPEIAVGDYAIVHVGFAISKIDEATAQETLATFRAMGLLDEELASEEEAFARAATAPQMMCPDGSCAADTDAADTESAPVTISNGRAGRP
jgi:hydrogenase expression/formation protein HypC